MNGAAPRLADLHLHYEGSLPSAEVTALAKRRGHRFADHARFVEERAAVRDAPGFLALFAEVCRLPAGPEDHVALARAVSCELARDGVALAEIYVSPEIFARVGQDPLACLEAVAAGLSEGEAAGGARCRILLDAVRHWGVESAMRVLDLHERRRLPAVVGFGIGGDETAAPAAAFAGVYERARGLGLKTSVHAGEWAGAAEVRDALAHLRPDRIDHGVAAAEDPALMARLAAQEIVLNLAPSGNVVTGVVPTLERHPLSRLLAHGVRVALGADDPLLFATSTAGEYRVARERLGVSKDDLRRMAENAWRAAFAPQEEIAAGLRGIAELDFASLGGQS
jgi:adenosine deaminase